MLVNILNESLEVVDSFDISFFDEIQVEAKKRIRSGSVNVGFFFRARNTFWRVVETDGTVSIEIDDELTEEAKRATRFRTREKARNADDEQSEEPQNELPQWIYPSKLLSTPQSAFNFPEYPGLSVAMRLYMAIGKISWFVAVSIGVFVLFFLLLLGVLSRLGGELSGILVFCTLPFIFILSLLMLNLGLAFQFASCEIVKVLVRNEENTRTVKKLLEKQLEGNNEE